METKKEKIEPAGKDNSETRKNLLIFARMSTWVAAPVILAHFLGSWLDNKYDSAPIFLIGVVGFAFLISMFGLIREASKEYRKIANNNKEKENGRKY